MVTEKVAFFEFQCSGLSKNEKRPQKQIKSEAQVTYYWQRAWKYSWLITDFKLWSTVKTREQTHQVLKNAFLPTKMLKKRMFMRLTHRLYLLLYCYFTFPCCFPLVFCGVSFTPRGLFGVSIPSGLLSFWKHAIICFNHLCINVICLWIIHWERCQKSDPTFCQVCELFRQCTIFLFQLVVDGTRSFPTVRITECCKFCFKICMKSSYQSSHLFPELF